MARGNAEALVVRLQDELKRFRDTDRARRERDERIKSHVISFCQLQKRCLKFFGGTCGLTSH